MRRSLLFAIWTVRSLSNSFWGGNASLGRTVSGLLAGICLVDLLALAGTPPLSACAFLLFFVAAVLAQKLIPAT